MTSLKDRKIEKESVLENIIPPEIKDDEFYYIIQKLAQEEDIDNVLEIGSSAGEGSTEAFVSGLKNNPKKPKLFCMEISKSRYAKLQNRYKNQPLVKCYNISSVSINKFPTETQLIQFYNTTGSALNNYPIEEVVDWLRQDILYLKNSGVAVDGIQKIKRDYNIRNFGMVLIDGSEFTGEAELDEIYGAKIIMLDDINAFKNYNNYIRLMKDPGYHLVHENHELRNGYAIFRRNVEELPIHFFTIVLNGQPFIRHHIDIFKRLPLDWHWHIIEGVADLKHDTSWCSQNGGRVEHSLHQFGLSNDGTSEYLDRLANEHPDRITLYRKGEGAFWDGKLEMVNAPLGRIKEPCILWQIDSDELWTAEQICNLKQMFEKYPEKTAAYFHCHFFVGPNLVTITPNSYSHNNSYEWLRVWRFETGMKWLSHEPPCLASLQGNRWVDAAKINPFRHEETAAEGLVFTHYAYATEAQVKFKEIYYGYQNAVSQWQSLQKEDRFPVYLREYFHWVNDNTRVDRVENKNIGRNVEPVEWKIPRVEIQPDHLVTKKSPVVIDGVIFQLQTQRPLGILRVWRNLLPNLLKMMGDRPVILLRRGPHSAKIAGLREIEIPLYHLGPDNVLDEDDAMLSRVCRQLNCGIFLSTYYTRAPGFRNILTVHDLIPEAMGFDLNMPEWRSKLRAIDSADFFIAVSDFTQKDLLWFYPQIPFQRVITSHNGVSSGFYPATAREVTSFKSTFQINHPYFLMVGNRDNYKNAATFFRAFTKIEGRKDMQILAVGGEPHLDQQGQRTYWDVNLQVIPWLEDDNMRIAYSGALALIYLSSYEGFGLPALEALACGCPVITTKLAAIPEVCGEAALYVESSQMEDIQEAVSLVHDRDVRENLKRTGLIRAKTFTWKAAAERIVDVINNIDIESKALKTVDGSGHVEHVINDKNDSKNYYTRKKAVPTNAHQQPRVSAIVSTFNAEKYIKGCLDDLENQTISDDLEIIVVNSGSEQNEEAIVKDFQEKYSNVKYIRTDCRETVYAAWNRGIKAATGKYITNANTDDRHRHDALEVMVNFLEAYPETALVYANVIITETENETFGCCTPVGYFNWLNFNREDLMNKGCFVGPQPMWRRNVHNEYGYFDDSFITSGDYEFWLRISQSHSFMHLPVQLGLYLRSKGSIEHSNREKQREENQKILNMYRNARSCGKIIRRIQASSSPVYSEPRSENTKSPETIYRNIQAEIGNKQPEETIKELEKLAAAFPDFALTFNDLGVLYYNAGDKEKSLKFYENAVRLDTGNLIFQKNLADFYYVEMGRVEDALRIYVKILEANPQDVEILLITGHICVALERFQDAEVFYRRVLEIEPGHKDARQFLDKLNSIEAGNSAANTPEAIYHEVQPVLNNGNPHRAIAALEGLLEKFPDYALAYNDLGVLYYHTGDKEKARHHYERAVEMMPENITFQKNLANFFCLELGRIEEALNIYVGILTTHPRDIDTLLATGRICEALERPGDAKEFYHRVLELEPGNEDASSNLQVLDKQPLKMDLSLSESVNTVSVLSAKVDESNDFEPDRSTSENRAATASIIVSLDGIQNCVKECIRSLVVNTPESHEILFINRGATKGILKWVQQLIKDNDHCHIIDCARQAGWAESLNQAVQKTSGEMIVLMHNDVVVPEGWLKAFKMCIDLVPNIGIVGPMSNRTEGIQQMIPFDEADRVEFESAAKAFYEQYQYRRVTTQKLSNFCLAFPRELADKIGYFDEQFASEEVVIEDFCKRATSGGYQNLIAADTYVHHYDRHKAQKSTSARNRANHKDRKKYKEKWNGAQNPQVKAALTVQLLERAVELSQKGQIDPAVEVLLGAIGFQPEDPRVYLGLSEILLAAKRFQDAKDALTEMPPADENQEMRKAQLLAYAEEGLGNYEAALAQIEQVLLMNPGHAPALNLKGILAYRNDDPISAEKFFKRAIDSDPGYGEPYTNLGILSLSTDRPQDALKFFEKAFQLTPTDFDIATNYHSFIGATADFMSAEVVAREAAALYPNNQKIEYMLIDFLVQQGKYEMAMPEIEGAIIKFGSDNGIINAALKVREKLGPNSIQKFSKMAPVSLCMIIKDEEKYLARCLASVKPIVDEMIVVDTGSTDRSKDIAIAFGAKVYDFDWENDFAEARNYSISKASGEWILILDGDEVISPLDHEHFGKIVQKTPRTPIAYSIITRNYNKMANIVGWMPNDGKYPEEEAAIGWLSSEKVRLFYGKDQIRFEGPVHELVDPVLRRNGIEIKKCPIPVHHYGRLDKEKLDRKGEIYFDIGRKKLSAMGDDLNALRELAVQATILEKNQEAFELWQRLLALNPNPNLAAIAYVNMGTLYSRLGKFEDALDAGKKAVECDPDLKEARYNHAMAELHCENASQTIRVLEDLLKGFPDYPPARFILSAAYCCADQKEKGLEGIRKLRDTPMGAHLDIPCLELVQSLMSAGKMEYALQVLGAAIECDIVNPQLLALFKECLNMKATSQKCSPIPQPPQANFQEAILENLPQ
ncbi:glycosyltransferase [Thermodesulfobacteriota bacterium]